MFNYSFCSNLPLYQLVYIVCLDSKIWTLCPSLWINKWAYRRRLRGDHNVCERASKISEWKIVQRREETIQFRALCTRPIIDIDFTDRILRELLRTRSGVRVGLRVTTFWAPRYAHVKYSPFREGEGEGENNLRSNQRYDNLLQRTIKKLRSRRSCRSYNIIILYARTIINVTIRKLCSNKLFCLC